MVSPVATDSRLTASARSAENVGVGGSMRYRIEGQGFQR
jgi:hypothetical protein